MIDQKEQVGAWGRLVGFLSDTEGQSKEEVRAELEADGVDVGVFLGRVRGTVRKGIQSEWRRRADTEMAVDEEKMQEVAREVRFMPTGRLREIVAQAEAGAFGRTGQGLAMAARNKSGAEPSEAELRACVEDILLSSEGDKKGTD